MRSKCSNQIKAPEPSSREWRRSPSKERDHKILLLHGIGSSVTGRVEDVPGVQGESETWVVRDLESCVIARKKGVQRSNYNNYNQTGSFKNDAESVITLFALPGERFGVDFFIDRLIRNPPDPLPGGPGYREVTAPAKITFSVAEQTSLRVEVLESKDGPIWNINGKVRVYIFDDYRYYAFWRER